MAIKQAAVNGQPHLVWVTTISPTGSLDSATWLDTTQALREMGWDVTLICKERGGVQTVRGIEVHNLAGRHIYLLGQLLFHWNALRLIWRNWRDVDVVLFHQHSALWLFPLWLLRGLRRTKNPRLVMDTRDLFDPEPGSLKVALQIYFQRFSRWLAQHYADGELAITPNMAKLVNVPSDKLLGVWPSGVDPTVFECARERQWPAEGEPVRLIYVGILLRKRNLLNLCKAVKQVNDEGAQFELTLYGDGMDRPILEEFAAASNGGIQVKQPVPHQQIPEKLAEAHVGVTSLPEPDDAKYGASSPIKMFEYMAAGLPMVATSNVCHVDVVGDGDYAFWAAEPSVEGLASALREVWQARAELPQLGSEAARDVDNWTWQAAARKLSDGLLRSLS